MLWISLIEVNPETERWAISREFPFATTYLYESRLSPPVQQNKEINHHYVSAYVISKPIAYFCPLKLPYNLNMLCATCFLF